MTDLATRKLQFIKQYLQISDEALIEKLEAVLYERNQKTSPQQTLDKTSVNDFLGVLDDKEAMQMKKDIEEACENIDEDDWQ